MARVYTEIRIQHADESEKEAFEALLDAQTRRLGLSNRVEYIRLISSLDASTGLLEAVRGMTQKSPAI